MSELRHNLSINLTGNMQRSSRRLAQETERLANRHDKSMRRMQTGLNKTDALYKRVTNRMGSRFQGMHTRMSRFGSRYGKAIAAGMVAGAAVAIKKIGTLDERVSQLLINNKKTSKLRDDDFNKVRDDLKKQVFELQTKYGIDDDQLFSAIEKIVEKTGDLKFAQDNLENFAKSIRATGAGGAALGGIAAELQKINIKDADQVLSILDALTAQGKMGAFTMSDMAQYGEKVFAAYQPKDETDIREMNAVMQAIRMATGSSAEAVTNFEGLMNTFQKKDDLKRFAKVKYTGVDGKIHTGVDVYKKNSKGEYEKNKLGNKVLRDLPALMIDLIKKSKGNIENLSDVFKNDTALKTFKTLLSKNAAGIDIKKFLINDLQNIDGRGTTDTDANRMKKTQSGVANKLEGVLNQELDSQLGWLSDAINDFVDDADPAVMRGLMYAAEGATFALGALAALSFLKRIPGIAKLLSKLPGFKNPTKILKPGAIKPGTAAPKYQSSYLSGKGSSISKPSLLNSTTKSGKFIAKGAFKAIPFVGSGLVLFDFLSDSKKMAGRRQSLINDGFKPTTFADKNKDYQFGLRRAEQMKIREQLKKVRLLEQQQLTTGLQQFLNGSKTVANEVVNQMRNKPGKIMVDVKVGDDRTRTTVSPVQNPTGFNFETYNTQEAMTK